MKKGQTVNMEFSIARSLAWASYADMLWMETKTPDIAEARHFAETIHTRFPGKRLAYNLSPSFNWKKFLNDEKLATFIDDLRQAGYSFAFVTLAGFHTEHLSMFELAKAFMANGMLDYAKFQQSEFTARDERGFEAVAHQRMSGAGYYDHVDEVVAASVGGTSLSAMKGSTEEAQFGRAWDRLSTHGHSLLAPVITRAIGLLPADKQEETRMA